MRCTYPTTGLMALCAVVLGCSPAVELHDGPAPARSHRPITVADVRNPSIETAYDAVKQLRPTWLRTTRWLRHDPAATIDDPYPTVYIQSLRCGGIECLDTVPIGMIKDIRFLSVSDATTKWGRGHLSGVIHVTLTSRG